MNAITIYKWVCYAIELVVVLALVWHWMKQCAAEVEANQKAKEKK